MAIERYTHTTYLSFRQQLQERLDILPSLFWSDSELKRITLEALRTYSILTLAFRERAYFNTVTNQRFYLLPDVLKNSDTIALLAYSDTAADLCHLLEDSLIESNLITTADDTPPRQITAAYILNLLPKVRDEFLAETSSILTEVTQDVGGEESLDITLPDDILTIRRASWITPESVKKQLLPASERSLYTTRPRWMSETQSTPDAYSLIGKSPLSLRLIPPASDLGTLHLLAVKSGVELDPSLTSPTPLDIPADFSWALKYGMLREVFSPDGASPDPLRQKYCDQRWKEAIALARLFSPIFYAELNGAPLNLATLTEADESNPGWESLTSTTPNTLIFCSYNMVALSPTPNSNEISISCDIFRPAILPINDTDYLQIGRDEVSDLLEYARHLALLKCGGMEFQSSLPSYSRIMELAARANPQLRARVLDFPSLASQIVRERNSTPLAGGNLNEG